MNDMTDKKSPTIAEQIAEVSRNYQREVTGHQPSRVMVVLSEDTLVITLHDALSSAEKALATTPAGAAQIQEYHQQLFTTSVERLRQEIHRITGRNVGEATVVVDPATGAIVQAFTSGTVVQIFLLEDQQTRPDQKTLPA